MSDFPADAYDRWKTTPDDEREEPPAESAAESASKDCYHPGRRCRLACYDPDAARDAEMDRERDDY